MIEDGSPSGLNCQMHQSHVMNLCTVVVKRAARGNANVNHLTYDAQNSVNVVVNVMMHKTVVATVVGIVSCEYKIQQYDI